MQDERDTTDIAGKQCRAIGCAAIATSSHGETRFPAAPGDDAEILRLFAEWLSLQRRYRFLDDYIAMILEDVAVPARAAA
jgi:hypothetical protein